MAWITTIAATGWTPSASNEAIYALVGVTKYHLLLVRLRLLRVVRDQRQLVGVIVVGRFLC